MRFPDSFIDDVKAAVPVVELAQRLYALRKAGAEFEVSDDPSMKINPVKNFWFDHGKGKTGGDVLSLQMHATGCTFEEAVEAVAKIGGIAMPKGYKPATSKASNGHAPPRDDVPPAQHPEDYGASAPQAQSYAVKQITATYDYSNSDGVVLYQVARQEWMEGGKRHKATPPRRAVPGDPEHWVWGLKGGLHLRGRNGDWYFADEDRLEKWKGADSATFEAIAPTLYRLPDLQDELSLPPAAQSPVFIPEGEKDADTLAEWGQCATTCMGGTNGWLPHFADYFQGADVIIPMDNDDAGRNFAHLKAASLRGIARRIRILDLRIYWPACPAKGDITDWKTHGEGNVDRLMEIVGKLPDWAAEPPSSSFNATRFADLDKPRRALEWLIKLVMQRGEMSVWFGDWGTGKSFLLTDAGFNIARGLRWMGLKTMPGLVIYQVGEGGIGFGNRMEAYRRHFQVPDSEDVPFVALQSRINLHGEKADTEKLIAEIKAWTSYYGLRLELVVIDTFSAATPGADENSGRDVGLVLERCRRIATETGSHVAVVHHVPKSGTGPRGWSGFLGNVDSAVFVEDTENIHEVEKTNGDRARLTIHQFTVVKQKDAPSKTRRQFVLPQVVLGKDSDGDAITSCVVLPLGGASEGAYVDDKGAPKGWAQLHPQNREVFVCLARGIRNKGRQPPPNIEAPPGTQAITVGMWQDEMVEQITGHEEITPKLRTRIKMRIYRASMRWVQGEGGSALIVKRGDWVWRTDRKVFTVDAVPRQIVQDPPPDGVTAPGETQGDLVEDLLNPARPRERGH